MRPHNAGANSSGLGPACASQDRLSGHHAPCHCCTGDSCPACWASGPPVQRSGTGSCSCRTTSAGMSYCWCDACSSCYRHEVNGNNRHRAAMIGRATLESRIHPPLPRVCRRTGLRRRPRTRVKARRSRRGHPRGSRRQKPSPKAQPPRGRGWNPAPHSRAQNSKTRQQFF